MHMEQQRKEKLITYYSRLADFFRTLSNTNNCAILEQVCISPKKFME